MSRPIIATAALLSARVIWNEFMFALVFVEDSALRTIPIGLMGLKSQVDTDWTVLLAGLTMSAIPIILLFIVTQKQFVRGMAEGGVKG
jgi:raffinose/stachyose/melibiose transport system permease protein